MDVSENKCGLSVKLQLWGGREMQNNDVLQLTVECCEYKVFRRISAPRISVYQSVELYKIIVQSDMEVRDQVTQY